MDVKHLSSHLKLMIVFSIGKVFYFQDFKNFWIHRSMLQFSSELSCTFIINFYIKKIKFCGLDISHFRLVSYSTIWEHM